MGLSAVGGRGGRVGDVAGGANVTVNGRAGRVDTEMDVDVTLELRVEVPRYADEQIENLDVGGALRSTSTRVSSPRFSDAGNGLRSCIPINECSEEPCA